MRCGLEWWCESKSDAAPPPRKRANVGVSPSILRIEARHHIMRMVRSSKLGFFLLSCPGRCGKFELRAPNGDVGILNKQGKPLEEARWVGASARGQREDVYIGT